MLQVCIIAELEQRILSFELLTLIDPSPRLVTLMKIQPSIIYTLIRLCLHTPSS
jgi:hypothetical protein